MNNEILLSFTADRQVTMNSPHKTRLEMPHWYTMITSQLKLKPVPLVNFIFLESPNQAASSSPFLSLPASINHIARPKTEKPQQNRNPVCSVLVGTPAGPVTAEEQCVDETCLEAPGR